MKLPLDTCTFLWLAAEDPQLSAHARDARRDPANPVYLSALSASEITIKHRLGRLPLPEPPSRYVASRRTWLCIDPLEFDEARFYEFHGRRDPAALGPEDVGRFLSSLAERDRVAASTQNQALAALLFLYREVLGKDMGWVENVVRAKAPARLPVVLSRGEVRALLAELDGVHCLLGLVADHYRSRDGEV